MAIQEGIFEGCGREDISWKIKGETKLASQEHLMEITCMVTRRIPISKLIISKWHDILKYTDDCTKM